MDTTVATTDERKREIGDDFLTLAGEIEKIAALLTTTKGEQEADEDGSRLSPEMHETANILATIDERKRKIGKRFLKLSSELYEIGATLTNLSEGWGREECGEISDSSFDGSESSNDLTSLDEELKCQEETFVNLASGKDENHRDNPISPRSSNDLSFLDSSSEQGQLSTTASENYQADAYNIEEVCSMLKIGINDVWSLDHRTRQDPAHVRSTGGQASSSSTSDSPPPTPERSYWSSRSFHEISPWAENAIKKFKSSKWVMSFMQESLPRIILLILLCERLDGLEDASTLYKVNVVTEFPMKCPIQNTDEFGKREVMGYVDWVLGYDGTEAGIGSILAVVETNCAGADVGLPQLLIYLAGIQYQCHQESGNSHDVFGLSTDGSEFRFVLMSESSKPCVSAAYDWAKSQQTIIAYFDYILEKVSHITPVIQRPAEHLKKPTIGFGTNDVEGGRERWR